MKKTQCFENDLLSDEYQQPVLVKRICFQHNLRKHSCSNKGLLSEECKKLWYPLKQHASFDDIFGCGLGSHTRNQEDQKVNASRPDCKFSWYFGLWLFPHEKGANFIKWNSPRQNACFHVIVTKTKGRTKTSMSGYVEDDTPRKMRGMSAESTQKTKIVIHFYPMGQGCVPLT